MVQFDANADAYAKVDTVACVDVKDEQPLKECTGYSGQRSRHGDKVKLQSATYSVSVHEATTGKETPAHGADRQRRLRARPSCRSTTTVRRRLTTHRRGPRMTWGVLKPFVQP